MGNRAERGAQPTSRRTTPPKTLNTMSFMMRDQRENKSGFTLIELMVVVALIALISVIALPSINSYFQFSLNSATRELASTIREAYDATLMTGKLHRIVYDLKDGQYWVEVGPNTAVLETKESREREERRLRLHFGKAPETKSAFMLDASVTKKKKSLPRGVTFEDVVTEQDDQPQTKETTAHAYTHFFPNGLTEQTIIHLLDNSKHHTSLCITPLLGRTDVYDNYKKPGDVFGK
jgi:prepilin-type N-terminal cleavage/methylation domain-containing protein